MRSAAARERIGNGPVAATPTRQGHFRTPGPQAQRSRSYDPPRWSNVVLLASPRGYCAGVERAVETVELALEHYGPPVVRPQADRPQHPRRPRSRGARRDLRRLRGGGAGRRDDRLLGARRRAVGERRLRAQLGHNVIDATCPLVTKVHVQARRYAARRLHRDPDRPRRPRGGRRHDGRGARGDGARAGRRPEPRRSSFRRGHAARLHHADDALGRRDRARSSASSAAASRRSTRRRRRTSVTRPPTGSGRSRRCSPRSTCCS